MGTAFGNVGKGNWADPTGLVQKSGASKWMDPLGFTKMPGTKETAADIAARQEMERQANIKQGIGAVNAAFDNPRRAAQISDLVAANQEMYTNEANRQQGENARQLKFANARTGNTGSRVAIDRGTDLGDAYQKSLVQGTRLAQGKGAALSQADDQARANLIALVTSGLDATTASQRANVSLQSGLDASRASANENELGDAFGGLADIYKRSQTRADELRAQRQLGQLYNTAPTWGYGGVG